MLCVLTINAQDLKDFNGISSSGELPKEVTQSSSLKYKVLESKVESTNTSKKKSKQKLKFYLDSTFGADYMLKNGYVLFNDPIGNYINDVADELLKDKPQIRKRVNFYATRAAEVNAFAIDRGSIFINVGLIARLETEAQLAFVLAHEIIHVLESHSMDTYIEFEEISADNNYRNDEKFDELLRKCNYSKKLEVEADREGMQLFLDSSYGTESIDGVFEILAKAELPMIATPFDFSNFNIANTTFSDTIFQDRVFVEPEFDEDEKEKREKYSSHPATDERKESIKEQIAESGKSGGEDFIIGENTFLRLRELAKFEICKIYLENKAFLNCLHSTYALEEQYPDNKFLNETKMKAYYGLGKYAKSYLNEKSDTIEAVEGDEISKIYAFVTSFNEDEVMALSIAQLWEYYIQNPENETMYKRLKNLAVDLKSKDENELRALKGEKANDDMILNGFFKEYMENEDFKKLFKYKKNNGEYEFSIKQNVKGYRLGINEVMFVNPSFMSINVKDKDQPFQFIDSEYKQKEMVDIIKKHGKDIGLKTQFLDVNNLNRSTSMAEFQEIIEVKKWLAQKLEKNGNFIPNNQETALEVFKKYKTNNLAFLSASSINLRKRSTTTLGGILLLAMPSVSPLGAFYTFRPENASNFAAIVVDINKEEIKMLSYNSMKQKANKAIFETNIRYILQQMKTKPKKR